MPRLRLWLLIVAAAVLALCIGSCSDDGSPPPDTKPAVEAGPDMPPADMPPSDQYVWPETSPPEGGPDQYTGGPFGCASDADCFGLKCCPTPWGVKLCAPTCGAK